MSDTTERPIALLDECKVQFSREFLLNCVPEEVSVRQDYDKLKRIGHSVRVFERS